MANREITLLELHFHSDGDVQVGPRVLGRDDEAETTDDGRSLRGPLLAGLALVALAAVAGVALRAARAR
jgi:hypothetical protein